MRPVALGYEKNRPWVVQRTTFRQKGQRWLIHFEWQSAHTTWPPQSISEKVPQNEKKKRWKKASPTPNPGLVVELFIEGLIGFYDMEGCVIMRQHMILCKCTGHDETGQPFWGCGSTGVSAAFHMSLTKSKAQGTKTTSGRTSAQMAQVSIMPPVTCPATQWLASQLLLSIYFLIRSKKPMWSLQSQRW